MKLLLNGNLRDFPALDSQPTIAALVQQLELAQDRVAVEHNGNIVSRESWQATSLAENDKLEVVHFVGGGSGRKRICFALTLALAAPFAASAASPSLQVRTESGTVEGKAHGTVRTFLGIPYAAPPVGELRWKPPAPAPMWTGIRKTVGFGPRCMQGPIYPDMVFRDPGNSEDCLSLNLWTPAKDASAKLPVMFWIHGGGFVSGASSEPRQDGAVLAKQGVIVVSLNYRLGIFGFFVLPELAAESPQHAAGNYGLLDQVAALQWVQRNIASFGGDPANVTIFGESAGSFSVSDLMASPLAKGLFQRAIGESGGAFFSNALPLKSQPSRAAADAEFASSHFGTQKLKELRALSAQKILDASVKKEQNDNGPSFVPSIDGYFLPESVPAIFAAGKQNDVPLLAGWNRDEASFAVVSARHPPTADSMKQFAEKEFGAKAQEFLRLYPSGTGALALRSTEDFEGDHFIAWSTWRWLEAQSSTGKQPVYRYRFDIPPPPDAYHPPGSGAYHSAEISYVFGTLDTDPAHKSRPEDRQASKLMQQYWTNFARTGDPNGSGLPAWPAYRSSNAWPVMYFTAQPKAAPDDQRARYLFLQTIWGTQEK